MFQKLKFKLTFCLSNKINFFVSIINASCVIKVERKRPFQNNWYILCLLCVAFFSIYKNYEKQQLAKAT